MFSTVTKLARKGALQQKLKSLFTYKVSSPPSLFQLKQALHQACWGAPTRGNESLRIVLLLLTASNYLLPHNAKDYKLYSLNSGMFGLVIPVTLDKWRQNLNQLQLQTSTSTLFKEYLIVQKGLIRKQHLLIQAEQSHQKIKKFTKETYIITCTDCIDIKSLLNRQHNYTFSDSYKVCLNKELKFCLYVFRAEVIWEISIQSSCFFKSIKKERVEFRLEVFFCELS